jgi:hypothetical protein
MAVPVEQCLRVYKSSFLLNRLNDAAFGKLYIPTAKFLILIFYINIPAFVIFCYWEHLDPFSICTFLAVFLASVPVLAGSALVMSEIYNISSQFKRNLMPKIQACENKAMKKVWKMELRSCQVVRCQVGNFYHMEGKAKLTLVDTMLNSFVFMVVQRKVQ